MISQRVLTALKYGGKKHPLKHPCAQECSGYSQGVDDGAHGLSQRLSQIHCALARVVEAAEKASAEIQSQHQMWPGEVDDLADALKELELALKECE